MDGNKLDSLEQEYSVVLSPVVRQFFGMANGFDLAWRFQDDALARFDTYIEGRAQLLSFHQMFLGFDGRFWRDELWVENAPQRDSPFLRNLKVIDYYNHSIESVCLAVTEHDVLSPELWLYQQAGPPLRLLFDLGKYLGNLRRFRAIWGWQWFYTDINLARHEYEAVRQNCELILKWYPTIFGDDGSSELNERYRKLMRR